MNKPNLKSITIDNFALMRDNSPIYYAESFLTKNYGFGNVLYPALYGTKVIDEDTATITNYSGNGLLPPLGMDGMEEVTAGSEYNYWIDSSANVWIGKYSGLVIQKLINNNTSTTYPDIKSMGTGVNSSVLFSWKYNVGRIFRGKATGGSATTLVDTAVNFTTADWALAAGDRVYNITQNKLFTIDTGGIAATTLTITAVSGGSFTANDYYCVVNPDWKQLSDNNADYSRQIIEFDEDFYILDGDAIAQVTSAGVFDDAYKSLEAGWIGLSGASNGDTIAIAANKLGLGKIFIWDKSSNGWNRKLQFENIIDSIIAYGNGYIFFSNNCLYLTDGYSTKKLSSIPDSNPRVALLLNPRGMIVVNDKVILNVGGIRARMQDGIFIYDIAKDEWAYTPYDTGASVGLGRDSYGTVPGIVYFNSIANHIWYSFTASGKGGNVQYALNLLFLEDGQAQSCVITNPIKLGKNACVKKIEVNLLRDSYYEDSNPQTITLDCKITDGTRPLWFYAQDKIDETDLSTITVNGTSAGYNAAKVGDEIWAREGWNGFLRRAISVISGEGTATEVWTLDAALPNLMKQDTMITVSPFQRYGMVKKTITVDEISSPLGIQEFYPNFWGDNIIVELYLLATSTTFIPVIKSITIYYE